MGMQRLHHMCYASTMSVPANPRACNLPAIVAAIDASALT